MTEWLTAARDDTQRFIGLWADTQVVYALYAPQADPPRLLRTEVENGRYPALSPHRPAAAWFERAVHDLWGHTADGAVDHRPWLDHGRWPVTHPLAIRPEPRVGGAPEPPTFLPAEGDDLHQVPVGPIHAGIIEPGHFRFTAQGETVVRLETLLGYTHKGTLALMRTKSPRAAARYAARLSGDSTVAHSIAFARAAEAASSVEAPPRAATLRAVMAEVERIANHLGDIGAVCGDVAFAAMQATCGQLRETLLRACAQAFGHRLMMDAVIPGGLAADILPEGAAALRAAADTIAASMPDIRRVYDGYASLTDRMTGTGIVPPGLARAFGAGGYVARASGQRVDARAEPGYPPYDYHPRPVTTLDAGDVDARLRIRLAEIDDSLSLLRDLLHVLQAGPISVGLPQASGEGIGWAEGFRGDCWCWLRLDAGLIAAAFLRDPSWMHWPLLEAAVPGNIIGDFPLINKSINASYSGVDL
ncbi:MAG TPA: NADH-quinone oxidoreductase subunit C [Acidisphaera sp.]|nr:NADH-quinone oxidoreductase subunit C [Acidisphaera sp.]